jgi:hypothetical protein
MGTPDGDVPTYAGPFGDADALALAGLTHSGPRVGVFGLKIHNVPAAMSRTTAAVTAALRQAFSGRAASGLATGSGTPP